MNLAILDYVLIALLLFFGVAGFLRGLISQLFSVIAIIAGFLVARVFYNQVEQFIGFKSYYGPIASFLLTFLVVFILVKVLGYFSEKIMKIVKLSAFNRVCGLLLGMIKGIVVCTLFISLLLIVYPRGKALVEGSSSATYFLKAGKEVYRLFPEGIKKQYENINQEGSH